MSDLRSKLEKLAAKWEAEAADTSRQIEGKLMTAQGSWKMGLLTAKQNCAADLRALLAEQQPRQGRMEPQPPKGAKFVRLRGEPTGWVWALITRRNACSGPMHAPSTAHIPVLVDGVWWWEVQP